MRASEDLTVRREVWTLQDWRFREIFCFMVRTSFLNDLSTDCGVNDDWLMTLVDFEVILRFLKETKGG